MSEKKKWFKSPWGPVEIEEPITQEPIIIPKKSIFDYLKLYVTAIIAFSAFIGVIFGGYQYWDNQKLLAQTVAINSKSIKVIRAERNLSSLRARYYELKGYSRKFPSDQKLKQDLNQLYRAMIAAEKQLRILKE